MKFRSPLKRFTLASLAVFAFAVASLMSVLPASAQMSGAVALLKGEVRSDGGSAISNIPIYIYKGTDRINSTKSDAQGHFRAILQPNATYRVAFNSKEYGYREDTVVVPALSEYKELALNSVLTALRSGQSLTPNTPVFLPSSSTIESEAAAKLEEIVNLMHHNNKLALDITVHPDAQPHSRKDASAERLLNSRAAALRSFFLGRNVPTQNVAVTTDMSVPQGRFPAALVSEQKSKHGKKRSKEPQLIPQYAEIAVRLLP